MSIYWTDESVYAVSLLLLLILYNHCLLHRSAWRWVRRGVCDSASSATQSSCTLVLQFSSVREGPKALEKSPSFTLWTVQNPRRELIPPCSAGLTDNRLAS